MPNFDARVLSGGELVVWTDPPKVSGLTMLEPARTNADPSHPPKYVRVWSGALVTIGAIVGQVETPLDVDLGGNLFTAFFAQCPWPPPAITQPAGQTSLVTFTPARLGFYHFVFLRTLGGRVFVPFWVEAEILD